MPQILHVDRVCADPFAVFVPRLSRLHALVASVTAVGAASVVVVVALFDRSLGEPFIVVALTLAAVVGMAFPFVVVRKDEGFELSFEEAVFAVAFLLLPAGGVLAVAAMSTVAAHVLRRRNFVKTLYNHGVEAVAVCLGLLVQHVIAPPGSGIVTTVELVGAGAGVLVFSVVASVLTWMVVATASGERFRDVAAPGLGFDVVTCAMAVSWGLVAATAARSSLLALVLCVVPVVMLRQLQHAERRSQHLDVLLATARSTASAVRGGVVEQAVTDATSEALRARGAVIRQEPPSGHEIGGLVRSRDGERWLIPGARHSRDPFKQADQTLLDGLAAIASIALENASFLEYVGRDPVTGLPSDALFGERVATAMQDGGRAELAAVMVIKIGRLNVVKQTFGPESASVVLAELGLRLSRLASEHTDDVFGTSSAGYLGDGEFALVVRGVEDRDDGLRVARIVEQVLRQPFMVRGVEVTVTVSIGVALSENAEAASVSSADLVRNGLATASRIARVGGDPVQIAQSGAGDFAAQRLGMEAELRNALDGDQLVVYYQPVVHVATGRVTGAEALVRWEHPERGTIPPSEFIPLAEETGLIVRLDRLVLTAACRQLARWRSEYPQNGPLYLSVNLSARQLAEPDLVDFVADLLAQTGIDPEGLCLEVTESGVMHDADSAAAMLRALRRLGLQLAIDDFGTGYSSLLYLRDFPVDALKIDRSFVDGMTSEPGDAVIVAATVRLAHALGLRVVAEGVETDEQLVQLRILGCDSAQGYLWGRAVPAGDFVASWLQTAVDEGTGPSPDRFDSTTTAHDTADEDNDDVLSYLAHELRSPLTAVTGYAHLLGDLLGSDAGDATTFVRAISRNAWELSDLLHSLEDARVVKLGTMRLQTELVEVRQFTEMIVESMGPQLDPHLVTVAPGEPATVIADVARLRQILRNLLSNAGKFSPPTAPIEVQVQARDGRVLIAVRDHGTGIPEERRHELFRRFSRLGNRSKGMGIGLHLSKAIARAHGGDITYEPAEGRGSIFTIELPAASQAHPPARPDIPHAATIPAHDMEPNRL